MAFPYLSSVPAQRRTVEVFGGLNRLSRPGDGEFAAEKNLTSDHYPVLSARKARGLHQLKYNGELYSGKMLGIGYCCGMCYVIETQMNDGDDKVNVGSFVFGNYLGGGADAFLKPGTEKKLIAAAGKMIVFPDKKWVNCAELAKSVATGEQFGSLEASWEGAVTCKPKDQEITFIAEESFAAAGFAVGDVVLVNLTRLDGIDIEDEIEKTYGSWNAAVTKIDGEEITVKQNPNNTITSEVRKNLSISRKLPEMDFVVECGNRLWGCRYGINADGSFVNEIYCSKLGDFGNWNVDQRISTDSWTATVGVDGEFTGIGTYLGRPVFFKENAILTVYGSYTGQYQLKVTMAAGVREGCAESVVATGDRLYYLARDGVCVYDGALPTVISTQLGNIPATIAAAGTADGKYYLSTDTELLVYDIKRNIWHREDFLAIRSFLEVGGKLYGLARDGKKVHVLVGAEDKADDYSVDTVDHAPVQWMAQTGPLEIDNPDAKGISALNLRLWMDAGSRLDVYLRYDFDPDWEHVSGVTAQRLGSVRLPIRPKRCDHLYLRLEGTGDIKLYSITKTIRKGSDRP